MNWLRRVAAYRILDWGAVALIVSVLIWWCMVLPPRWSEFDFSQFYVSGRMLLTGRNPYTTSLEATSHALGLSYSPDLPVATYPPSFLWIFTALAMLPPQAAFAVWVGVELVCLIVLLWLTRRLLGERLTTRGWLFVVALAVTSRTVSYHLCDSQVQLLLAALVLGGYAAQRAGRGGWACTAVSTAGMLKLYPFVLLPWFIWSGGDGVRGRCRRLLGVFGFVVVVFVVTGPGLWRDFFRYGMPSIVRWQETGKMGQFSLAALLANLGYWHSNFQPTPEARSLWWFVGTGAGLAVIATAYGACLVWPCDSEAQFCLLCTAMLIGTATVQNHYFVFMVFPLTVAAVRVAARPTLGHVLFLGALLLAFNCVDPLEWGFLWRHLFLLLVASNLPLYGLFALAAFFGRELREQTVPPGATVSHSQR